MPAVGDNPFGALRATSDRVIFRRTLLVVLKAELTCL